MIDYAPRLPETRSPRKTVIYSVGLHALILAALFITREQQRRQTETQPKQQNRAPRIRYLPSSPTATAPHIIPQPTSATPADDDAPRGAQAQGVDQTVQPQEEREKRTVAPVAQQTTLLRSSHEVTTPEALSAGEASHPYVAEKEQPSVRPQPMTQAITSPHSEKSTPYFTGIPNQTNAHQTETKVQKAHMPRPIARHLHAWHKARQQSSVVNASQNAESLTVGKLLETGSLAANPFGVPGAGRGGAQTLEQRVNGSFIANAAEQYIASVAYSICFSLNRTKIHAASSELPRLMTIHVTIRRNGALANFNVEQTSHDYCSPRFYEYVQNAVRTAAPFNQIPALFDRNEITLSFYINARGEALSQGSGPITFYLSNPREK